MAMRKVELNLMSVDRLIELLEDFRSVYGGDRVVLLDGDYGYYVVSKVSPLEHVEPRNPVVIFGRRFNTESVAVLGEEYSND